MLSIIVAMTSSGVIGVDGKLPWHIPSDLKRFRQITEGHTIVMGRRTFESLPGVLPNRVHIVLTRGQADTNKDTNVMYINDWKSAVEMFSTYKEEAFVIGGAEIYKLLMPYVDRMYITLVEENIKGDTYFPYINTSEWNVYDGGSNYYEAINGEPLCNYLMFKRKKY